MTLITIGPCLFLGQIFPVQPVGLNHGRFHLGQGRPELRPQMRWHSQALSSGDWVLTVIGEKHRRSKNFRPLYSAKRSGWFPLSSLLLHTQS